MAQQGKWAAVAAGVLAVLVLAGADAAQANDCNSCPVMHKLGRGLANTTLGLVEVPVAMIETSKVHGQTAGFFVGSLKGLCRAVIRTGAGLVDTLTFPFPAPMPDYEPMITPEFPPNLMEA